MENNNISSAAVVQESAQDPPDQNKENPGKTILRFLGAFVIGSAVGIFIGFFCQLLFYLFSLAALR